MSGASRIIAGKIYLRMNGALGMVSGLVLTFRVSISVLEVSE
jgi:hypothetical protein